MLEVDTHLEVSVVAVAHSIWESPRIGNIMTLLDDDHGLNIICSWCVRVGEVIHSESTDGLTHKVLIWIWVCV